MPPRSDSLLLWLLALLLAGLGPSARAADPEASFALEDGELNLCVQQGDTAIKDVRVRVLDLAGATLAEGECDPDGRAAFPLPVRPAYLVCLGVPGKPQEADPVALRRRGSGLTPARVRLSFSQPCCRRPVAPGAVPDRPDPPSSPADWKLWLAAGGAFLLAAGAVLLFVRRAESPPLLQDRP